MYLPLIESARRVRIHSLGLHHVAVLLTNIKSPSRVEYTHMLVVFDLKQDIPAALVTSEKQADLGLRGKRASKAARGTHFLCAIVGSMHSNYGASDDWADLNKFERAALDLVERLELTKQGSTNKATNRAAGKSQRPSESGH